MKLRIERSSFKSPMVILITGKLLLALSLCGTTAAPATQLLSFPPSLPVIFIFQIQSPLAVTPKHSLPIPIPFAPNNLTLLLLHSKLQRDSTKSKQSLPIRTPVPGCQTNNFFPPTGCISIIALLF